ncbi:MAG: V4R domain-containing protein [Thermoplasmatota archaeon]
MGENYKCSGTIRKSSMSQDAEIYSTTEGAVIIKSEVKNEIIHLLLKSDMTLNGISEELDKAKSTVSVHLSDLKDLGVIEEKTDPSDSRKKIFLLNSKPLGGSQIPYEKHYKEILENLREAENDKYGFLKSLFHLIRFGLISFGLDIHPALREIGRDAGRSIAKDFESDEIDGLLEEISTFWDKNGLGDMEIAGQGEVIVHDCFDCGDMPDVEETLCSLDEGMIEGIIEEKTGRIVEVREKECYGKGNDHCKFCIDW